MAREEAASERAFDPIFRTTARELLATLPLAELLAQSGDDGLGLNSLGDTQADLVYTPVTPCRIVDTRVAGGILSVGVPRSFRVTGTNYSDQGGSATSCGVPYGPATAAVINLVAVTAAGPGNLKITPYGQALPTASIINYATVQNVANGVAVAICNPAAATCTSDVTIQANVSQVHLVVDIQGYFRSVSAGGVSSALLADAAVTAPKIASGVAVRSLNAQTDTVTLAGANGLSVSAGAGTVTVSSNATSTDTAGAIVARDGAGGFSAGSIALAGNLALPNTTGASVGILTMGGAPFLHNSGTENTFVGRNAGNLTLTGNYNSAFGALALYWNTTGGGNAAFGSGALLANTTGSSNSAFGLGAVSRNTTGYNNSAFGHGALFSNTTGLQNAAFGVSALNLNTTASGNSAFGYEALWSNRAEANSAFGYLALRANTTGASNVAFGAEALSANTTAAGSSAFGYWALRANTAGGNSAFGSQALTANTTGGANSSFGYLALRANTEGGANSAFGGQALTANVTGFQNSAFGLSALYANTTGSGNSAFGLSALYATTTGSSNSAFGMGALSANTTGLRNIAVGYNAGAGLTSGDDNIYVANSGVTTESRTIRIGTVGTHTATYIAGISGASVTGSAVYVNSNGQLGTTPSSRRYKERIADMDAESDVLLKLRPVSFYYRPELDETHLLQYGLVAEEVADVAPRLVAYDQDGAPQTVRYHFVNAMLLNEVQKQRRLVEEQKTTIEALEARLARLEAALTGER